MKTRDTRWRQSTAGHKEALQGHEERVFSWQLFSSIPLFSGPCLPDNATSKLCQSFALHSVHDKILLINNCAFTVVDTSNQHMVTVISLILCLKYLKEINFHEWSPTHYNSWSLLKQQTHERNVCILGCRATEGHWEKHMAKKNRFFPCFKILLKNQCFPEKIKSTQQQEK